MEYDIMDAYVIVDTTIDVRFIPFDMLIDKLKEIRASCPSETRVAGVAKITIYYNKTEGGAK